MMGARLVFALLCAWGAAVAGCSSPSVRFYTLSTDASPGSASSNLSLAVGPVSVPPEVNRAQIVVTTATHQVAIDEYNRWASPLQDDIARVVADDLTAILGSPHVTLSSSSPGAEVDYRVQIEVRKFESSPGEDAVLDALWTVRRLKDGKRQAGRSNMREPAQEAGFEGIAAAHSRAIARLSQDIASAVRMLDGATP
jgi:uncharacterized lipoprotein YmbA